jgi:hypothetical protein
LPTFGSNIIEISRCDFSSKSGEAEVIRLSVFALRNEVRDTVDTFCQDAGYMAAGTAGKISIGRICQGTDSDQDDVPRNTPVCRLCSKFKVHNLIRNIEASNNARRVSDCIG